MDTKSAKKTRVTQVSLRKKIVILNQALDVAEKKDAPPIRKELGEAHIALAVLEANALKREDAAVRKTARLKIAEEAAAALKLKGEAPALRQNPEELGLPVGASG